MSRAAEELGSKAAAAYSMSSAPTETTDLAVKGPEIGCWSPSSSTSRATTEPSASLPMKRRSRIRTVPDSVSFHRVRGRSRR